MWRWRRKLLTFFCYSFALATIFAIGPAAHASKEGNPNRREVWAGADASSQSWLVYSGASVSPFGHVYSDGLRLRASAGYGRYKVSPSVGEALWAETAYSDALVGYLQRFGELTAKGFIGIAAMSHNLDHAAGLRTQGTEYGPKAVVELWLNMGPDAWTSLDLNWTSAHDTYAARLRTGYRPLPNLTVGIEAGLNSTDGATDQNYRLSLENDEIRGGLFVRSDWSDGEISVSAGVSEHLDELLDKNSESEVVPYVTVNWLTQF